MSVGNSGQDKADTMVLRNNVIRVVRLWHPLYSLLKSVLVQQKVVSICTNYKNLQKVSAFLSLPLAYIMEQATYNDSVTDTNTYELSWYEARLSIPFQHRVNHENFMSQNFGCFLLFNAQPSVVVIAR